LFRWWTSVTANRIVARVIRETPIDGSAEPAKLEPESLFVVAVSDSDVSCTRPDKTVERVRWADLESVELVTADEGPFSPDVFWVLQGSTDGCVIPQGASGERLLLERLQGLPGFDNVAVIRAITLTANSRLRCWRKPVAST
jgi:hypothetical protein